MNNEITKGELIGLLKTIPKKERITGINIEHDVVSIPAGNGIMEMESNGLRKISIYFNDWE